MTYLISASKRSSLVKTLTFHICFQSSKIFDVFALKARMILFQMIL